MECSFKVEEKKGCFSRDTFLEYNCLMNNTGLVKH